MKISVLTAAVAGILLTVTGIAACSSGKSSAPVPEQKNVLVINEGGGQHGPFTEAAMKWLRVQGEESGFKVTEIHNTEPVNEQYLDSFSLVIQLDYPPYMWPDSAKIAFEKYIDEGRGSWIGFHHATLLGDFDGYPMWEWFSDFMGGIRFNNYIAETADGTVTVEDTAHPVMAGIDSVFVLPGDEWYTYDRSPRPDVHVIASVDEDSYVPASDVRMGDHPVVWTNLDKKARNVYFQMGHSPRLFDNEAFTGMFANAVRWCLENK